MIYLVIDMGKKRNPDGTRRLRRKVRKREENIFGAEREFCGVHKRQRLTISEVKQDKEHGAVKLVYECPKCEARILTLEWEWKERVLPFYIGVRLDNRDFTGFLVEEYDEPNFVFVEPPPEYECPDCQETLTEEDDTCPKCGISFVDEEVLPAAPPVPVPPTSTPGNFSPGWVPPPIAVPTVTVQIPEPVTPSPSVLSPPSEKEPDVSSTGDPELDAMLAEMDAELEI